MRRWLSLVLASLASLAAAACSSSGVNEAAVVDAGAKPDVRADVPAVVEAEPPFVCDVCSTELSGEPVPPKWQCLKTMDAQVEDLDGKPLADVTLMACSPARCVHNDSDANGKVHLEQCAWLLQPAFRVVGFDRFAQFAIPLQGPATDFVFKHVKLVPLPPTGPAFDVGKAQVLTQNGATLELLAGAANVTIDPLGAYTEFRAVELPVDKQYPGLDDGLGFGLLYELGPQNADLSPPAKLTLPNRKAWPKGTAVEFWLQNYDSVKDVPVDIGRWYRVSGGAVSDDGATVVTDVGIPRLSLVGVRPKP